MTDQVDDVEVIRACACCLRRLAPHQTHYCSRACRRRVRAAWLRAVRS